MYEIYIINAAVVIVVVDVVAVVALFLVFVIGDTNKQKMFFYKLNQYGLLVFSYYSICVFGNSHEFAKY